MEQLKSRARTRLRMPALFLALYFVLLPFDCFAIAGIGSLLRIVALLPMLMVFLYGGCRKLYLNMTMCSLILYVVAALCSMVHTVSDFHTESEVKTLILNVAMIVVVSACYEYNAHEIEWLKKSLIAGSWLTATLMLVMGRFSEGRLILSMGNSVQDANYANGYMLFAYSYHLGEALKKKKTVHIFGTLLLLIVVLATGSRGALLAYAGCTLLQLYCSIIDSKKKWNSFIWIIFVVFVAVILISKVIPMLNKSVTDRFSKEFIIKNGTTGRSEVWNYLINYYGNSSYVRKIFGYGYGTTAVLTDLGRSNVSGMVAHNLYIDLLLNIGAIGLMIFMVMQLSCLKNHIKRRKDGLASVHFSYLIMCMSLSLLSYKPLWATIIMGIIADYHEDRNR